MTLNKVDDSENDEQRTLLKESRGAVENLFQVTDREKALETLLSVDRVVDMAPFLPAVVPISAMHAFLYRCGSRLSFDEFCHMDREFIDSIGKESYGRQWKRFNDKKKLEKAFEAVSDEEQRQDGLQASNIDTFLTVLRCCIGGQERQGSIIRKQVDVAVGRMSRVDVDCDLGDELRAAKVKLSKLGLSTEHLRGAFWQAYQNLSESAVTAFETSLSPTVFARPLEQLASYMDALKNIGWEDEATKVCRAAKELVLQYAVNVLENEKNFNKAPRDFSLILGSMLLLSHDALFCTHFGPLKLELDLKYAESKAVTSTKEGICQKCNAQTQNEVCCDYCTSCATHWISRSVDYCPYCLPQTRRKLSLSYKLRSGGVRYAKCNDGCRREFRVYRTELSRPLKVEDGRLVPVDKSEYMKIASIVVPDSIGVPNHFGFPLWQCCRILEASNKHMNES